MGDRFDIRADHRDLSVRLALVHGAHRGEAGVVHEHLDGETALLDVADELFARLLVRQVRGGHLGADAVGSLELAGELPERRFAASHESDSVAPFRQLAGDVHADARGGARDEAGSIRAGGGEAHARTVEPRPARLTSE
jgi:hypothetical protein